MNERKGEKTMQNSNVFQMNGKGTTADQRLADSKFMLAEADKRLNETLERFRNYNDGSEEDILCMVADWAEEREGMS